MRPRQTTFADTGFEKHYKPTRREQFLNEMEQVEFTNCDDVETFGRRIYAMQ